MSQEKPKQDARLDRQFAAFERGMPFLRRTLNALRDHRYRLLRIPAGVILFLAGFLSILPVFGLWMTPLGLLLLAVDIPALRPAVAAAIVRLRRRLTLWRRRLRGG